MNDLPEPVTVASTVPEVTLTMRITRAATGQVDIITVPARLVEHDPEHDEMVG